MNSASFSVFYLRRDPSESLDTEGPRAGFTTPRALGKAHDRNRIRRRMREAVRHELSNADPAVDFIFHPRRNALDAPIPSLRREVEKVFLKCRT